MCIVCGFCACGIYFVCVVCVYVWSIVGVLCLFVCMFYLLCEGRLMGDWEGLIQNSTTCRCALTSSMCSECIFKGGEKGGRKVAKEGSYSLAT